MKIYLKTFFSTAVPFIVLMCIYHLIFSTDDLAKNLGIAAITGVFLGLVMTFFWGSTYYYHTKVLCEKEGPYSWDYLDSTIVQVQFSYDDTRNYIMQSITNNSRMKLKHIDPENGNIYVIMRKSILSWGDEIRIEFRKIAEDTTDVLYKYRPVFPMTIFGYLKNYKSYKALKNTLAEKN